MGPRPFGRGRCAAVARHRQAALASMGPRPFGRGRRRGKGAAAAKTKSFNGAATFRSRKAEAADLSSTDRYNASMGPRPFGRGRLMRRLSSIAAATASMGPRPFGRGRDVTSRPNEEHTQASMGPRPFGRGRPNQKVAFRGRKSASMGPRPFGRGRAAAWPGPGLYILAASMGPRPFGRGRPKRLRWQRRLWRFNGAATFRSRKGRHTRHVRAIPRTLQWGRDLSVAEGVGVRL